MKESVDKIKKRPPCFDIFPCNTHTGTADRAPPVLGNVCISLYHPPTKQSCMSACSN